MKRILIAILLIMILGVTSCSYANPDRINDNPPINVSIVSGNVTTSNKTIITDEYGFDVENTPFNELRIAQSVKLAGTVFIGTTLDTNFISTNTTGTGTVTQGSGQMVVATGAGANGYAEANTQRRGRFVAGNSNMAKLVIRIPDSGGTLNNKRRWGIFDLVSGNSTFTDGAYFQINGNTFGIATVRGGVETPINSGSFNGNYGATYVLDSSVHVYEIYYSPYTVYFSLDGKLLHTVQATGAPWTNTVAMYCGMDNQNSNGLTTNVQLNCRAFSIHRFGPLDSAPTYKTITTGTTTVCKYGAGTLHRIILANPIAQHIVIYDNTSATGTIIMDILPATNPPSSIECQIEFSTGLTVVTNGSTQNIVIVYE